MPTQFVDWLAAAGQSWWQVLPLGPARPRPARRTRRRPRSPAGRGLLAEPGRARERRRDRGVPRRARLLDRATGSASPAPARVADQVRFEREWSALRAYAAARGVRLIGDIPIYVAPDSADHRAHPELFQRGLVAGAPPDALSATGQLWGNPLYDWRRDAAGGLPLVDRALAARPSSSSTSRGSTTSAGFVAYWSVPARRAHRARRALAARTRRGALRGRSSASSASCR